jgi:hypothetical protein
LSWLRMGGRIDAMKTKAVVTQLYRLNVEPKVIDQLAKISARTGEPKTRLARRLFTDAVMAYKPTKNGAKS